MQRARYLNLGCGDKFHKDWLNLDLVARSPHVRAHDLRRGIPCASHTVDVVYHSHVLEHLSREDAPRLLGECLRVLRPGGVLRVVVPDLEEIAREYLRQLQAVVEAPSPEREANYEWILLELYDQTVRDRSGGEMAAFLQRPHLINEDYVLGRIGAIGHKLRREYLARAGGRAPGRSWLAAATRTPRWLAVRARRALSSRATRLGRFRLEGEVHLWMYDRFSLSRLLTRCGFVEIEQVAAARSAIPDWSRFELDVRDGLVFDPTSLFMEARKPGR